MRSTFRQRRHVRALLAVALAGAAAWAPTSAQAAISTCGTYYSGGHFDGYSAPGVSTMEGVYAKITTHTPASCTTDGSSNNMVSASIMMSDTGGSYARYAQAGYLKQGPSGALHYYSSYNPGDGSGAVTTISGTPGVGTTNAYTVKYITGCSCLGLYANAAQLDATPFNPFSVWSYPFDANFIGTATYDQNDMPGTSAAVTRFSVIQVQDSTTNNFRSTSIGTYAASTPGNSLGRWSKGALGSDGTYGNYFDIWTP